MRKVNKFGYEWYKGKGCYLLKKDIDSKNNEVAYIFYSGGKWREDKVYLENALEMLV